MSGIPEIRHHIRAVEDTRKITRAMYLISSAKMQKAMRMHERNMPYFHQVREDMRYILENTGHSVHHPFFERRPGNRAVYLVIAGDKGMCGSYNADVLRAADERIGGARHAGVSVLTIGATAYDHFARRGMDPDVHYLHLAQDPSLGSCRGVAQELCAMYDQDQFDEAYVVFTNMLSSRVIRPETMRLLPILAEDLRDVRPLHVRTGDLEFVPGVRDALYALAPQHLIGLVYSACVQSYAAEHSARMAAMDASTRNADEMLGKLRMEHQRARQTAITQELGEIISGADSVRE